MKSVGAVRLSGAVGFAFWTENLFVSFYFAGYFHFEIPSRENMDDDMINWLQGVTLSLVSDLLVPCC